MLKHTSPIEAVALIAKKRQNVRLKFLFSVSAALLLGTLFQAMESVGEEVHPANCEGIADRAHDLCMDASGSVLACKEQKSQTRKDCDALAGAEDSPTVVVVNPDGTFFPQDVTIKSGDTVLWSFSERTDSIVPTPNINIPHTNRCTQYKPYDPTDPNEFIGPLPRAPSGIYLMSLPDSPYSIGDSLWTEDFTGVFIRMQWNDVHLGPGQFNWAEMDHEIDLAVRNGKLFSLGFKAGSDGTPDWIFNPDIVGASRVIGLELRDGPTNPDPGSCGPRMTLGSPADPNYRTHYFELLKAVADHIKSRNAWYRALAHIKLSGANLFSHENRLPQRCWSPTGSGLTNDEECDCQLRHPGDSPAPNQCVCNPQIWATEGGYTPAAIQEFYSLQAALLARELPDKDMSYMLIQDGLPWTNNAGEYEYQEVVNAAGEYFSNSSLPSPAFDLVRSQAQMKSILDQGAAEHNAHFLVQHNALGPKPQYFNEFLNHQPPLSDCAQEGQHPVEETTPISPSGSKCPSPHVLEAGARNGSITGFQTINNLESYSLVIPTHVGDDPVILGGGTDEIPSGVNLESFEINLFGSVMTSTFANAYDNSDAVFVEIYKNDFIAIWGKGRGSIFKEWADKFHERRRSDLFRDKAPDPFPLVHGHRSQHTLDDPKANQVLYYLHGSKCDDGDVPHIGSITIEPY